MDMQKIRRKYFQHLRDMLQRNLLLLQRNWHQTCGRNYSLWPESQTLQHSNRTCHNHSFHFHIVLAVYMLHMNKQLNCILLCNGRYLNFILAHLTCSCLLCVQVVDSSVFSVFGSCFFISWSTNLMSRVIIVMASCVFRGKHPCNSCSCRAITALPRKTQKSCPHKCTAASEGSPYVQGYQGKVQELHKRPEHQPGSVCVEKLFSPILCYVFFTL